MGIGDEIRAKREHKAAEGRTTNDRRRASMRNAELVFDKVIPEYAGELRKAGVVTSKIGRGMFATKGWLFTWSGLPDEARVAIYPSGQWKWYSAYKGITTSAYILTKWTKTGIFVESELRTELNRWALNQP